MNIFWLAVAGAAGTVARFGVMEGAKKLWPGVMPWGTWAANLIGCLLFGLIWSLAEERSLVSAEFRFYALVGFMGAFTTFSTFAFESVDLARTGHLAACLINLAGQNVAGVAAVLAGMALARFLT